MKKIFTFTICLGFYFTQSQTAASIYGMAVKTGPQTFLGKINTTTGVVTNISSSTLGGSYVGSLATIDPKKKMYYYENGSNQFMGIDLITGNMMTSPTITNPSASFFDLVAYDCLDSAIYGLARATGPTRLYLAKIDPLTGIATNISASSIGNGFISTPSTLDPVNKRFYWEDGSFLFTTVDMITGNILSSPAITYPSTNANLFDCFVYNCADSVIYGLARKNSPSQMYLSKINPTSGLVTFISASNINSNGQTSGGATIDPINKIFYFQDGNQNLLGVSLLTGNVITNTLVTNVGANSFTNFRSSTLCCSALSTGINFEKIQAGVKVYPNPFSDNLKVTLHSNTEIVKVKLMSLTGQLISEKVYSNVNSFCYDAGDTANGIYFLEVNADGEISRIKVVKN